MDHYVLPKLPYEYDALEPYIDKATMKVHYEGHHKTYVEKLNSALKDYPDFRKHVEELLASLNVLPEEVREAVATNAGGHANHSLFWSLLTPNGERRPVGGEFSSNLDNTFGNFDAFKQKFTKMAVEHFSNGWIWLAVDNHGKMELFSTKDHESPITRGMIPLLVLDVWEHAYYLKHQNRRPEYIHAFWNIVNWTEVSARWDEFKKTGVTNREWRRAG